MCKTFSSFSEIILWVKTMLGRAPLRYLGEGEYLARVERTIVTCFWWAFSLSFRPSIAVPKKDKERRKSVRCLWWFYLHGFYFYGVSLEPFAYLLHVLTYGGQPKDTSVLPHRRRLWDQSQYIDPAGMEGLVGLSGSWQNGSIPAARDGSRITKLRSHAPDNILTLYKVKPYNISTCLKHIIQF